MGRGEQVETSQSILQCVSDNVSSSIIKFDDQLVVSIPRCSSANFSISMFGNVSASTVGLDNASATKFASPWMWRMSVVYWNIKSNWRISRGEYLSEAVRSAKVSGL